MARAHVIGLLALSLAAAAGVLLLGADEPDGEVAHDVVGRYCLDCHNAAERAGDLVLDGEDLATLDAETSEAVIRKLRTGMMPPAGEARPGRKTLDAVAAYFETQADAAAGQTPNPGAPALHRLNRAEYANAIRDLLALEIDAATLLPADDSADGFDNIAGVLTVSPALIEAYVSAGMKLSRRAIGDLTMLPKTVTYRVPAGLDQSRHFDGLPLGTRGGLIVTHDFPVDAEYEISVAGGGGGGGFPGRGGGGAPSATEVVVNFDGKPVETRNPRRFRMRMPAGPVEIAAAVVDRSRGDGVTDYHSSRARGGGITQIQIDGPYGTTGPGDTPSRRRIFSCYPQAPADEPSCAREILTTLASTAYRELLAADDPAVDALLAFYEQGREDSSFDAGIERALAMLLVNPRFLFRLETEPDDVAPGTAYRISDVDLASRLSFFLWSSIPDTELLTLAAAGRLGEEAVLREQVERMLADPKAAAFVENFAGQWLLLRSLASVEPEAPGWDENLRQSMRRETELLFANVVNENRPITELLDARYTFVDERLARHYGIDGVKGSYFRRVELAEDSPRRGILGQGSFLTATSVANRTSPVVRGAWILENLLGAPPPAPPAGVESNLDDAAVAAVTSLRERLEQHRGNPTCAACHAIMDPVGLSLENFDSIGAWRTVDSGKPIDPVGTLVDGTQVSGPVALRRAILERREAFVTAVTEKLMTYALGRGVEYYDMPAIRGVVRNAAVDDYRFAALIYGIVSSTPFQMRIKSSPEPEA